LARFPGDGGFRLHRGDTSELLGSS
jgi:hypothetical protein